MCDGELTVVKVDTEDQLAVIMGGACNEVSQRIIQEHPIFFALFSHNLVHKAAVEVNWKKYNITRVITLDLAIYSYGR